MQSPLCDGLARGRRVLPRLSFLRGSSPALYRPARLQAGGLPPSGFQLGTLPLAPSIRFESLPPAWEEGLTTDRLKRRRRVLFWISGQPPESRALVCHDVTIGH